MTRMASAGDTSELKWFKSGYSSGPDGDSCVEVALAPRTVHIRDSKNAAGPMLAVGPAAWASFVAYSSER
ncbi:DUF397 domain-containing protein [Streptomyces sp. NPDC087226]|uniref:DUF397 domain-containing protein n=1 Tax=Streptomyces sp. NPDC087226 TaxID=3365771 RepID=UPI0037FBD01B